MWGDVERCLEREPGVELCHRFLSDSFKIPSALQLAVRLAHWLRFVPGLNEFSVSDRYDFLTHLIIADYGFRKEVRKEGYTV